MGQPSGGLHHSEGSGPLPHQAGKRLPPAGFKNQRDSAVANKRRCTHTEQERACWKKHVAVAQRQNYTIIGSVTVDFKLHFAWWSTVGGYPWVFPTVSIWALMARIERTPPNILFLPVRIYSNLQDFPDFGFLIIYSYIYLYSYLFPSGLF